ncbi:MAG: acetyl-CoA carboxylase biotin carboxyl carrier protein [Beijerinckiaceae bacterium]|nr:acetyl-CoA carboxylase biotin carboxyl carrier protein [Beijerinckiaceae bacterium]
MKYPEPKPEVSPDAAAIDMELIANLAQLVSRLGLSEIEVKKGDFKVRVARQLSVPVSQPHAAPQYSVPAAAGKAAADADGPGTVKSPMVGTAYLRTSPEAAPFVEVGARVKTGDKLLLVEAMKTFNEILAPRDGTVTGILVEDGQPVEYGQPLLVIE